MSLNYQFQKFLRKSRCQISTEISEEQVKLLGIYTGNRINFDYHVGYLSKKARKKLQALTRVFKYMNIS